MSDPASRQPAPADDLYDVDIPAADAPPATPPPRPRRPPRAAAPPPPFKVPAPRPLDLVKAHLARAFAIDGGPGALISDEQRAFEVARPKVATEHLAKVLLWRRASLTVGGLLLALAILLHLASAAPTLSSLPGPAVLATLAFWGGLGALGWTLWRAFAGWDAWAGHRRALRLGLVAALAAALVGALPRASSLYLFALAPCLVGATLGALRAAAFAKATFPGSPLPGWLVAFAAPVHAALSAAVLLMAWHGFQSAVYLLAALTVAAIPAFHARAAAELRRPMAPEEAVATLGALRLRAWLLGGMAVVYYLLGAFLALSGGTLFTLAALALAAAVTFIAGVVAFDLAFELRGRAAHEAAADGEAEAARLDAAQWAAFEADAAREPERSAQRPGGA